MWEDMSRNGNLGQTVRLTMQKEARSLRKQNGME